MNVFIIGAINFYWTNKVRGHWIAVSGFSKFSVLPIICVFIECSWSFADTVNRCYIFLTKFTSCNRDYKASHHNTYMLFITCTARIVQLLK